MKKRIYTSFTCSFTILKPLQNFPFKKGLLLTIFSVFTLIATAQIKTKITGTIRDDKGAPASNVSIMVKGSSKGVTTNSEGAFSIEADPKAALVISSVGFATQEIALDNKTTLNLSMVATNSQLDAVVVVGYGTQKESNRYRGGIFSERYGP